MLNSYRSLFYFLCAIQAAKEIERKDNGINMTNIRTVYNNTPESYNTWYFQSSTLPSAELAAAAWIEMS